MSKFFTSRLADLTPYTPGEQPQNMERFIKLNTNESPFPPSEKAQANAAEAAKKLNLYSDPECKVMRNAMAELLGVDNSEVIFTNGSDEVLNFAFMSWCDENTPAAFADITYGFYPVFAALNRVPTHVIPLREDFSNEYTELRDTDLMKRVFTPYLPRYQKKEISGRTVLLKNLYVLDEEIKFTSGSVNELRKLFPFRIEISDRRLQGENISPYYKDVFTNTFLWKDGILTLNEYKEEVEYILTALASPAVPYGEFETTLSALITSGLLPAEYKTFAEGKREELEKEEAGKGGKRKVRK